MIQGIFRVIQGIVKLRGNTDGTLIGNSGDRLKVDTTISAISVGAVNAYTKKLRYSDMNASTGGIARSTDISTTWTDVFNYSGSGVLVGFLLNLEEKNNWAIRLIIDGSDEIFDTNGLSTTDLNSNNVYDLFKGDHDETTLGPYMHGGTAFSWRGPLLTAISYSTSVNIKIKRLNNTQKKFQAGLVVLTKET